MADDLFGGPEAFGFGAGAQPGQAARLQAPVGPALHRGGIRRIDQQDGTPGIEAGQGRLQEQELADAGAFGQEFDQRTQRPAAAGQRMVEGRVPGGHGGAARWCDLAGPPQGGVDALGMLED